MRCFNLKEMSWGQKWGSPRQTFPEKNGQSVCLNVHFCPDRSLDLWLWRKREYRPANANPRTSTRPKPVSSAAEAKNASFWPQPVSEQIFGALQGLRAVRGLPSLRAALPGPLPPQRSLATSRRSRTLTACTHTTARTHRWDTLRGGIASLSF